MSNYRVLACELEHLEILLMNLALVGVAVRVDPALEFTPELKMNSGSRRGKREKTAFSARKYG